MRGVASPRRLRARHQAGVLGTSPSVRPPAAVQGAADRRRLRRRTPLPLGGLVREQAVDLLIGVSATALDPAARRLALQTAAPLIRQLLIATGGRPRTLPILAGYDNVSVLRTLDDAVLCARCSHPRAAGGDRRRIYRARDRCDGTPARRRGDPRRGGSCPLASVLGAELGGGSRGCTRPRASTFAPR